MNTLQLEYLLEVARTGSISQAANNLYMNQPNLSKSIKEIENSLGVLIFNRTPQGVTVTPKGEEVLRQAQDIIDQVNALKQFSKRENHNTLSVAVPQASYLSMAFYQAVKRVSDQTPEEITTHYRETPLNQAIQAVVNEQFNIGIIRYGQSLKPKIQHIILQNSLKSRPIYKFRHLVTVSAKSPLAKKQTITQEDLKGHVRISADVDDSKHSSASGDRMQIINRSMQYMLLNNLEDSYSLASPVPPSIKKQEQFVQIPLVPEKDNELHYDELIYLEHYTLSNADNVFLEEINNVIKMFDK